MIPKLRFQEFEDSWSQVTIAEAASFRRGSFPQPYNIPQWYDDVNGMPFVQVVDVGNDFRLKPKTKQMISEMAMPKSVFVPKGSIVITIQGSIGRIALTQYDSYVDRTLLIITEKKLPLDDYFFIIALKKIFDYEKTIAVGGTIKTITKEKLAKFKFSLPHHSEQQRIGDFIRLVDQKINLLTKKKEAFETYKKGLMQKIFSQELRFKREDGTDYPKWKKVKLSDEYEYLNAKAHEQLVVPDGRYKLINSKFVSTGGKVFKTVDEVLTEAKIGDVTMVLSDLPNGKALAKAFYIDRDDTYAINQRVCRLRALDSMENDSRFLYYLISRHRYFLKLDNGVGQTHISKSDVLDFQYFKPSLSEQVMISNTFNLVDDRIAMTIRKLNRIQQIKKGLLQQMFV